jgi:hypothetical protein
VGGFGLLYVIGAALGVFLTFVPTDRSPRERSYQPELAKCDHVTDRRVDDAPRCCAPLRWRRDPAAVTTGAALGGVRIKRWLRLLAERLS